MKEILAQYSLFLARVITAALAVILILFVLFSFLKKINDRQQADGIRVIHLNDRYRSMKLDLEKHFLDEDEYEKQADRSEKEGEAEKTRDKRLFVLDFKGDLNASAVTWLRKEITAVLTVANPDTDEVLLRLESGGGLVHSYGLAASQLQRIRDRHIPLTIAVDKIAASGGYMMACVADRIIAAPFAMIGSIGVIMALPNFHRFLKKHDIDYEQITAGEYKRTITLLGKVTEKGREKKEEQIREIHTLFKQFVAEHRPILKIDDVSTGEVWYGTQARKLALVDDLSTSDDFLMAQSRSRNIYEVQYIPKKRLSVRISSAVSAILTDTVVAVWSRMEDGVYP